MNNLISEEYAKILEEYKERRDRLKDELRKMGDAELENLIDSYIEGKEDYGLIGINVIIDVGINVIIDEVEGRITSLLNEIADGWIINKERSFPRLARQILGLREKIKSIKEKE